MIYFLIRHPLQFELLLTWFPFQERARTRLVHLEQSSVVASPERPSGRSSSPPTSSSQDNRFDKNKLGRYKKKRVRKEIAKHESDTFVVI